MLCFKYPFSCLFSPRVYFSFHLLISLPLPSLSPSWIIALLTCFVQSTQTYFLWCLPAAWLSLAHPSSAKAAVFLLTTAAPSEPTETIVLSPAFSRHFLGHLSSVQPSLPYILPLPAPRWLFLPGFRRSWEGSEQPGAQVGAVLWIFIISFKSLLCSGE